MAVHYSAAEADRAPTHDTCDDRVRGIQNYHMDRNGWVDIAYSFLSCYHGAIFEGRGWGVRTAANGTNYGNDHFLAVCFLGADKVDRDDVTDAGRQAIHDVVQECRRRVQTATAVYSHSDLKATACPGNELRAWVRLGMPLPVPERSEPSRVIVNAPFVTLLTHPSWNGYLEVCEDGGVFGFGQPPFYGSLGGIQLAAPIVDADVSPTGLGYAMVGADGGVFTFGDVGFEGGHGPEAESAPVESITITPTGNGYWLGLRDGTIHPYGDAQNLGSVEYRG